MVNDGLKDCTQKQQKSAYKNMYEKTATARLTVLIKAVRKGKKR